MDELTDPGTAVAGEPDPDVDRPGLGRAAATLTVWNLISRITGFARVVVTGAALGIMALGDAFQRANLTSNILFELLAGGVLSAVLVPSFVSLLARGRGPARALGEVLLARVGVAMVLVAVAGIALGELLMRALTAGVGDATRDAQVELGTFLLWFFMPQLVLYGVGAVATGLLQADHRFTAAAMAPVANNVVAITVMVAFAAVHDPAGSLALTVGEKVLLGAGTLAGTVAMTAIPLVDLSRQHLGLRPRWRHPEVGPLGDLARSGAWGAGHVGLNQVLVAATVVFAGQVAGGVIAYQVAFAFFLLPHAVLAHPIFTALYPRLAAQAEAGDLDGLAHDVSLGLRSIVLLLVPAAIGLAVVARPLLDAAQLGAVDDRGSRLVALVLASYAVGLLGYSAFFLLTRASYAVGDVRSPTLVNLGVTVVAIAGMVATSAGGDDAVMVGLGISHGVAVTGGSIALGRVLRRRIRRPLPVVDVLGRSLVAGAVAGVAALAVVALIDPAGRAEAIATVACAGALGTIAYVGCLLALRVPEATSALASVRRRVRPSP